MIFNLSHVSLTFRFSNDELYFHERCVFSRYYRRLHSHGRVMRVIISAYNILKNIDVASWIFMRNSATFAPSVSVEADSTMAAFTSRLRVTRKRMSFSLRNFCIDCATNSLPLSVCKYMSTRPSLFTSTRWKAFITQLFVLLHNSSTYLPIVHR